MKKKKKKEKNPLRMSTRNDLSQKNIGVKSFVSMQLYVKVYKLCKVYNNEKSNFFIFMITRNILHNMI